MSILTRLFTRQPDPRTARRPLYQALVGAARSPVWYREGVPDTLDGRFNMVTTLLAALLLRLERDEDARVASVHLTELYVDDMDGQLRQIGIGDLVVGKHIGRAMAVLGGRIGALREQVGDLPGIRQLLVRNMWNDADPGEAADRCAARLAAWQRALDATSTDALLAGDLPPVTA